MTGEGGSRGGEGRRRGVGRRAGSWTSGTRERREIPKIEEGEAGVLILGEGMGELLKLLQYSLLTHFGMGEGTRELPEIVAKHKPIRHIASRIPTENTRNPPIPETEAEAAPEKARGAEIGGARWWCGGWAARGARCSHSPTSGGGRPTPGPPSATPSSPPSQQVFENHRIVFTVGTSVASVLTAWAGYSLRHVQQTRIDRRLESIESSLKDNHKVEHEEIKKIVTSSNISTPACVATAMTTMVVGYALGWRGGAWYARRAFRREQQKLMMGHMKSQGRWHWRPFNRLKNRLRRASKNKSEDAHGLAQSTDAPSSSGASANISNTAQPAAGSA